MVFVCRQNYSHTMAIPMGIVLKRMARSSSMQRMLNISWSRQEATDAMVDFYRQADLVIFDAMYSLADMITIKEDWGHSSNTIGVDLCLRANVKHYCMFHHEPVYDDATLYTVLQDTVRYEEIMREGAPLQVSTAYDGLVIHL